MKFVQSDDSAFPVRQHCAAASIKLHNTKRPARPSPAYELHVFVDPHAAPPALPAHSSTKRPRTPLLTPPWPQTSSARPRISYSAPFHSSPTETPCPDTTPRVSQASPSNVTRSKSHGIPRHDLVIIALARLKRLAPPARTQAPLAAALEADLAQVVALLRREREELLRQLGCTHSAISFMSSTTPARSAAFRRLRCYSPATPWLP